MVQSYLANRTNEHIKGRFGSQGVLIILAAQFFVYDTENFKELAFHRGVKGCLDNDTGDDFGRWVLNFDNFF